MTGYQTFYEHHPATPGTPAARHFRHWLPERQEVCLEAASGLTAEDMHIHYDSVKPSAAEPVQFLKPLGVLSYLRSLGVRSALRAYHAFCDSVQKEELLDRWVLDQLKERLNAVRNACGADNPLHQNLLGQVDRELGICDQLRQFQTKADEMANLLPEEPQEIKDKIWRLYYAGEIKDHLDTILGNDFLFGEKICNSAIQVCDGSDTLELSEALIRLHTTRFHRMTGDRDVPVELRNVPAELQNVLRQVMDLTHNIPIDHNMRKSAVLMKRDHGYIRPVNDFETAQPLESELPGEIYADLVIGLDRGKESIDMAQSGLLHEMTHAAVQRTFHNTPMHLGFGIPGGEAPGDATRRAFTNVLTERTQWARQLKRLIAAEEADPNSPFSKKQLRDLKNKFEYGVSQPLLGTYATAQSEIAADKPGAGISAEAAAFYNEIENFLLESQDQGQEPEVSIHGSIFMEYDATINQMLLWCYNWGIRSNNPLYRGLAEAAQHEVDRRDAVLGRG